MAKKYYKFNMNDGSVCKKLSLYTIGDFVKLIDVGGCYTSYWRAFEVFKIADYNPINLSGKNLPPQVHKDATWIVCNFAIHGNTPNTIIYHIKNKYNEHLVVCQSYLKLHKEAIKKYPLPFLQQIPSADF